jgi:hypothetical protein
MLWKRSKNTVYSREFIFRQKEFFRATHGAEAGMTPYRDFSNYE